MWAARITRGSVSSYWLGLCYMEGLWFCRSFPMKPEGDSSGPRAPTDSEPQGSGLHREAALSSPTAAVTAALMQLHSVLKWGLNGLQT